MKLPIKKKLKKYKQYNSAGLDRGTPLNTNNIELYLTTDSYGSTPLIDLSLPANNPANVRAAIALKQGWVEVPISEIDIDVNRKYRKSIERDLAKYGPNAKYIVDPNTRLIIPEKVFDTLRTELGFLNTSGAILDNNAAFEIQLARNHRDLQRRDPLGLAYATLAAGTMTNPVTAVPLMYLGQAKYAYDGYKDAYQSFKQGNYGLGLLKAGTTTALTLLPYGKAASALKFAPKVGIPLAAGLMAADAYASNTEPHDFASTLSPEDKAVIEDENTPWEEIGNDVEAREHWNKLIEAELRAAHFTYQNGTDNYGQRAKVVLGNKGEGLEETSEETPLYKNPWTYVRYGLPFAIEGPPLIAKYLLKHPLNLTGKTILNAARGIGWPLYFYGNLAADNNWWPFQNTGTEENPDGYDEGLALYYQKLVNAYLRLNSGLFNGYTNGSTFSPYQTYQKRKNYDWGEGKPFDKPDTNAIVQKTGRLADTTRVDTSVSADPFTKLISDIKVPQ